MSPQSNYQIKQQQITYRRMLLPNNSSLVEQLLICNSNLIQLFFNQIHFSDKQFTSIPKFLYQKQQNQPNQSAVRIPNTSRIHHSFDSKINFFKTPDIMPHQLFQQYPRQPVFEQVPGSFYSQCTSPFASMIPIVNSQSFDPFLRQSYVNNSLEQIMGNTNIGLVSGLEELRNRQLVVNNNNFQSPPKPTEQIAQQFNELKPQSTVQSQEKWISFKDCQKEQKGKKQNSSNSFDDEISEDFSQKKKRKQKRSNVHKSMNFSDSESYQIKKIKKPAKSNSLNDTKNITKNFAKAIISFILQNKELTLQVLGQDQTKYNELADSLKKQKNAMTNIKQLRQLWTDSINDKVQKEFNQAFRIIRQNIFNIQINISQHFLKKLSICYIYNSRISNTKWHLKYRQNLLRAIKEPDNFKYIKDI